MTPLTFEQAIVVSGYTGFLACNFEHLHADLEKRMGRPVFTHEIPALEEEMKALYRDDFFAICRPWMHK